LAKVGAATDRPTYYLPGNHDLNFVNPNKLIVLAIHIGLTNYIDRDTRVTMQVDERPPVEMRWNRERQDPLLVQYPEGEEVPTSPGSSPHLYSAPLPEGLEPGAHMVTIRTVNPYGQAWVYSKVFEVAGDGTQASGGQGY